MKAQKKSRESIAEAEKKTTARLAIIIAAAMAAVILLCLLSGRYNCTRMDVLRAFCHGLLGRVIDFLNLPARLLPSLSYSVSNPIPVTWERNVETALWTIRAPRILAVIFIGGGLAVSGASYQCLFKNPLVSESILGVSSGASLGAAIGILFSSASGITTVFAFCGGILAVFLTFMCSQMLRGNQTLLLVLSGSVISSIFSAGLSIVKYIAPQDTALPEITFWLMGSFSKISVSSLFLLIPIITVCLLLLLRVRWQMNLLALGDEEAKTLGVNVQRTRVLIIVCSTLITAVSVCVCGMVGWIGVVIPQVTRMRIGPDARILIPCAFFVGAIFLMIVDLICRTLMVAEIPVGIVTSLTGAPVFILMLKHSRDGWL